MPTLLNVDLAQPPEKRWSLSPRQLEQATELLDLYLRDLGADDGLLASFESCALATVPSDYLAELSGIAEALKRPMAHVLAGNLYYDAIKTLWGCTAFAVETARGPIHARNLDWMTHNRVLNDHTLITTSAMRALAPSRPWVGPVSLAPCLRSPPCVSP